MTLVVAGVEKKLRLNSGLICLIDNNKIEQER